MPGHRIPKTLGLHRQAGIALYRALLTQCRAVPLPEQTQTTLRNTVRNRFWHNRNQISPRFIKLSFHAGYKALDLLDAAASGDTVSSEKIADYVNRLPKSVSDPPTKRPLGSLKRVRGSEAFETPPEKKVLNVFPRADEGVPLQNRDEYGVRRVPVLVNAQGRPFIRFKRHQPKNLSRVLRQKAEAYFANSIEIAWFDQFHLPLARYEDQWDEMIAQQRSEEGRHSTVEDELNKFETPMRDAHRLLRESFWAKQKQGVEFSKRMYSIVQQEAELARQERERLGLETDGTKTKYVRKTTP